MHCGASVHSVSILVRENILNSENIIYEDNKAYFVIGDKKYRITEVEDDAFYYIDEHLIEHAVPMSFIRRKIINS